MFKRRSSTPNRALEPKKVFKRFLQFLEADIWSIPTLQFMEQNSIVFDREQGDPKIYEQIHRDFKQLVDTLVDSYCQDSGITTNDLIEALKATENASKLSYREKVLLEPMVAAQDFNVFVPMMMRKNIELQLQALKMLEHLSGLLPSSLKLDESDAEIWKVLLDEDESERLILISVLRQSKEEWEKDQKNCELWQKELEAANQGSVRERELLETMKKMEQKRIEEAMKTTENGFKNLSIGAASAVVKTAKKAEVKKNESLPPSIPKAASPVPSGAERRPSLGKVRYQGQMPGPSAENAGEVDADGFGYRSLLKDREQIDEEQIRKRAEYLRDQRDKLMEKKRLEREKQFKESVKKTEIERPRTAKAARGVMSGQQGIDSVEARRNIAAKIKAEVMHKE